jgi:hypothetical protein
MHVAHHIVGTKGWEFTLLWRLQAIHYVNMLKFLSNVFFEDILTWLGKSQQFFALVLQLGFWQIKMAYENV